MAGQYIEAARGALLDLLELFREIALPLAILLGLLIAAGLVAYSLQRDVWQQAWPAIRSRARSFMSYAGVALLILVGWSILRQTKPLEAQALHWRESAEAAENPAPEAPPVYQYGPLAAALNERTYSRTLTLPPDFLQRLGAEGVGVIAPYLSDPSAEGVLKLVDTFRKSGQDAVLTREVTRLEEIPMAFDRSTVNAKFRRLGEKAYDVDFEGTYRFSNTTGAPIKGRFTFALPQFGGTIRDLHIEISGYEIKEPNDNGVYEWSGEMQPGQERTAKIRYSASGSRKWHYDIGSTRRRVRNFELQVTSEIPVEFTRGSLLPSRRGESNYEWQMENVVTAQQVNLSFPPDVTTTDTYLQAMAVLPAAFVVFAIGAVLVGIRSGRVPEAWRLAAALATLLVGLGSATVLENYIGPGWAVLFGPVVAAICITAILEPRYAGVALASALVPAAFLSPRHTGPILLLLVLIGLSSVLARPPKASSLGQTA